MDACCYVRKFFLRFGMIPDTLLSVGVVGWGDGNQNVEGDLLTIGYLMLDDYLPSQYRLFNVE